MIPPLLLLLLLTHRLQGEGLLICIGDVEAVHTGPSHAAYGQSPSCNAQGHRHTA